MRGNGGRVCNDLGSLLPEWKVISQHLDMGQCVYLCLFPPLGMPDVLEQSLRHSSELKHFADDAVVLALPAVSTAWYAIFPLFGMSQSNTNKFSTGAQFCSS